jgi:hypothetical protein
MEPHALLPAELALLQLCCSSVAALLELCCTLLHMEPHALKEAVVLKRQLLARGSGALKEAQRQLY